MAEGYCEVEKSVKERPVIFSAPMVRALLDGTKTQTRRIIKPELGPDASWQPWEGAGEWHAQGLIGDIPDEWRSKILYCPYGVPGDRLWVRETWRPVLSGTRVNACDYRADDPGASGEGFIPWRPSIHMPRVASRITLEITDVRVERLAEISEADAMAEGVGPGYVPCPHPTYPDGTTTRCVGHRPMFMRLWNEINEKRGFGWEANPWLWVISFRRVG